MTIKYYLVHTCRSSEQDRSSPSQFCEHPSSQADPSIWSYSVTGNVPPENDLVPSLQLPTFTNFTDFSVNEGPNQQHNLGYSNNESILPGHPQGPAANTNLLLQYVGDYTSPIRPSQPHTVDTAEQVGGGPQQPTKTSGNVPSVPQSHNDTKMHIPDNLPPSDIEPTSSEDEEDQSGARELREHTPSPAPRNPHATTSVRNAYRRVPTNKNEQDANQLGLNHKAREISDDAATVRGVFKCYLY